MAASIPSGCQQFFEQYIPMSVICIIALSQNRFKIFRYVDIRQPVQRQAGRAGLRPDALHRLRQRKQHRESRCHAGWQPIYHRSLFARRMAEGIPDG